MRIVILEDDSERRESMLTRLEDRFPLWHLEFFNSVAPMIAHLERTTLEDVIAISLDHDLEMLPGPGGTWLDAGTGVEIARWLSQQTPTCPVLVHTTNALGGDSMVELLENSHWKTERIVPYEGTTWIDETWFPAMRLAILSNAKNLAELESSEDSGKSAKSAKEFPRLDVDLPRSMDPQRR